MEKFNTITVTYNSRTTKYTFVFRGVELLYKHVKKLLGSKRTSAFLTFKSNTIETFEFFLLELEFIIDRFTSGDMAVKLIDILTPLNDVLKYIRTKTWVATRYTKFTPYIDVTRIEQVMKFKPMPHQLDIFKKYEEIKHYADLRGFMIDAAAGLGKTYTSLALGEGLGYDRFVIIAPRQVIDRVWVKSVTEELYRVPQSYLVLDKKTRTKYQGEKFLILHYEELDKLVNNTRLLRQLRAYKPILIIDEFHNFNEITSKRTKNLLQLANTVNFKDIVTLTGTPIKFDSHELVPLLYILDRKFPKVVDRFKQLYANVDPIISDLILYRFNLYRKRVEKKKDMLPPITIKDYKVKIPNGEEFTIDVIKDKVDKYKKERLEEILANYEEYETIFYNIISKVKSNLIMSGYDPKEIDVMFDDYLSKLRIIREKSETNELMYIPHILLEVKAFEEDNIYPYLTDEDKKKFKFVLPIIKYPKFKVMGEALGKIILGSRIQAYRELARYTNYKELLSTTTKKGLIFSNYISVCEIAIGKLKEQGYKPLGVYGPYTKQLPEIVKKFNTLDTDYNPLVATYKSLSTGVPLTAANEVICLDLPFRLYIFDQAVSRVHRIGQDKPVIVFIVKLDTGDKYNITDRDLFILNLSKMKVELITANKVPYEVPKSELEERKEDEKLQAEKIVEEDIEETAITEIEKELTRKPLLGIIPELTLSDLKAKIKILFK